MFNSGRPCVRRAFTLIEVLVVIFIVFLLICILIPAVQYAREASRRMACLNNLKQIGTALNSYEASHGVYPQGSNGRFYSAHSMLLPHLDQAVLYNNFNFNVPDPLLSITSGSANDTASNTHVSVFCCPSDPDSSAEATTNYSWNGGLGLQLNDFVGTFGSAASSNLHAIKPSDITDGLSNTAAMTEWQIGHINSTSDVSVVFKVNVLKFDVNEYVNFVRKCEQSNRRTTEFGVWKKDASWINGHFGSTLLNFNSLPNSMSCFYGFSIDFGNWPASSYHASGVNVLFHDGHVDFYKNSIAYSTWRSIATKSAGDGM